MSQASLKFFRNPIIKVGSKQLKLCGFSCAVMRFAILAIYLETDQSYFVDVFAKRYVLQSTAFLKQWFTVWITSGFSRSKRVRRLRLSKLLLRERDREVKSDDLGFGFFMLLSA